VVSGAETAGIFRPATTTMSRYHRPADGMPNGLPVPR